MPTMFFHGFPMTHRRRVRSAVLALALGVSAVGLPALAGPATAAAKVVAKPTTVHVAVSRTVTAKSPFTVHAQVTHGAGRKVEFEHWVKKAWHIDGTAVVPKSGFVGRHYKGLPVGGYLFRVVVRPTATRPRVASAVSHVRVVAPVKGATAPDKISIFDVADHAAGGTAGYDQSIRVTLTTPTVHVAPLQLVEYAVNGQPTGSWLTKAAAGTALGEAIGGLTNGIAYSVQLRACNTVGQCGPWSAASTPVTPYGLPKVPVLTTSTVGETVTFTWSGGGGNGRAVVSYHVCVTDLTCQDSPAAGSVSHTYGLSAPWTFTVSATDSAGQVVTAPVSTGTTPGQFPVPGVPTVTASQQGTVVTWAWSGGTGSALAVDHYNVCVTDLGCSHPSAVGSASHDFGYSKSWTVTVTTVDSMGQTSAQASQSGTTASPGGASAQVYRGMLVSGCSGCYRMDVSMTGFAANTTYQVSWYCANAAAGGCSTTGTKFWPTSGGYSVTTDGAGNGGVTDASHQAYFGYPGGRVYAVITGPGIPNSTYTTASYTCCS
jgi:hypothetical protein